MYDMRYANANISTSYKPSRVFISPIHGILQASGNSKYKERLRKKVFRRRTKRISNEL